MTSLLHIARKWTVPALAALFVAGSLGTAQAASPAEDFIQSNVSRGLAILDSSEPKEQKRTDFRSFLIQLTDLKRIALYTLGPAKNVASPADVNAFVDAFKDYAFAVYETEFQQYSGQTIKVTGSLQRAAGDYLVRTVLLDPHKSNSDPIKVDFRVMGDAGHFSVVDITVEGLDLAITEQDDFQSFLAEHNNNVKQLTENLKQRAENVRATGQIKGN